LRPLLTRQTVVDHLVSRGQLQRSDTATVEELSGGVSCVVLRVGAGSGRRVVVKQARRRLQVADEWIAPAERVLNEAAALELVGRILPGSVPRVLDLDSEGGVVTIECAAADMHSWKQDLMSGDVDADIASFLGEALARIHSATTDLESLEARFDRQDVFTPLRIDPYYRTTAARRPELAPAIHARIDRLKRHRRCLVHGDFAPKNVLVGASGRWIIDLEVAHIGSPVFDTGFMLNHLLLKGIHAPGRAPQYHDCGRRFITAYQETVAAPLCEPIDQVAAETGCLMLARVDGKSPAEYLTPSQQTVARELGRTLLLEPPSSIDELLERSRIAVGR
jgi:5-methylthioribose kinase